MKYSTILSLQFVHGYFSPGNEEPFRLELTADCEKRMKYFAQVFRQNKLGFSILKDMEKIRVQGSGKLNEDYVFDIGVFPAHSDFFIYSNFEANFRERISYYTGFSERLKVDDDLKKRNSLPFFLEKSIVGENKGNQKLDIYEAVPVVLKPEKFSVTVDANTGDHFALLDMYKNTVNQWDITGKKVERASFYIDAAPANSGFLELERNGTVVSRYFAENVFYKTRPPILLSVGLSLEQLKNASTYSCMECSVHFSNRPVYWNYHIIAKGDGRKLENLEIINNNQKMLPGVTFSQTRIDREKNQADFISDRPLPLIDKGYIGIELVDKESYGSPLIANLPNPDIRSVRSKKNRWISDIFVYV